jgi:hypothetical protein
MEEIKNLLEQWEEAGTASGAGIEISYQIINLLVAKIEQMDAEING